MADVPLSVESLEKLEAARPGLIEIDGPLSEAQAEELKQAWLRLELVEKLEALVREHGWDRVNVALHLDDRLWSLR